MTFYQSASVYSPLVRLSGQSWASGESTEKGDQLSFDFEGTSVMVHGSVTPSSIFDVFVDQLTPVTVFGSDLQAVSSPTVLFSAYNLTQGAHTITIINQTPVASPDGALSLSTIDWTMDLGQNTTEVITIDDMNAQDATLMFKPSGAWRTGLCTVDYYDGSCHLTVADQATFTITFFGTAISVFGGTNSDHGNYTVRVDGGTPTTYSGHSSSLRPRQLLAHAIVDPPDVKHTVTITNNVLDTMFDNLDVDYVQVFRPKIAEVPTPPSASRILSSTVQITAVPNGMAAASSNNTPLRRGKSQLSTIVGASIGLLIIILMAISMWRWWWPHRRQRKIARAQAHQGCLVEPWAPQHPQNHLEGQRPRILQIKTTGLSSQYRPAQPFMAPYTATEGISETSSVRYSSQLAELQPSPIWMGKRCPNPLVARSQDSSAFTPVSNTSPASTTLLVPSRPLVARVPSGDKVRIGQTVSPPLYREIDFSRQRYF